ncbi:NYN domain-containing protein [Phragmitibacter flavus]|nr:NYN domain-containing protein [Phragmitibacter flavus]
MRFLLVDGHSVIHAWPELRQLHVRAAKRYLAREGLLKRMRLLQDLTGERVVVVFDGRGGKVSDEREAEGVQVFYSDDSISADGVIERLAAKYAQQVTLRVCTGDGMVWETVGALGAGWISPETLAYEVQLAEGDLGRRL